MKLKIDGFEEINALIEFDDGRPSIYVLWKTDKLIACKAYKLGASSITTNIGEAIEWFSNSSEHNYIEITEIIVKGDYTSISS